MNDLELLAGVYGLSSALFLISRKLSFHRKLRMKENIRFQHGSVEAELKVEESDLFYETITFFLLGIGALFGIASTFYETNSLWVALLIINIPVIVFIFIIGFDSRIIDINNMTMIDFNPKRGFLFTIILMIWSFFSLLIFRILLIKKMKVPDTSGVYFSRSLLYPSGY